MRKQLFRLLAIGLFLAQGTLVSSFLQCQECGSGTSDKDCSPGCETCVCCSMPRLDVSAPTEDYRPSSVGVVPASPILPPQPAYPQDIFHVPRLSLS
jgi:hypothetical protein